jgi:cytochrome c
MFEHRVRSKDSGRWYSRIEYVDEAARPDGYTGLKVSCASCHSEAGTGKYNDGLVPGGDTVLSDPLDWSLVRAGK